jgi:hypothetical protein
VVRSIILVFLFGLNMPDSFVYSFMFSILLIAFDAETTMVILNILAHIMVGLMLLSVLTAIALDLEERSEPL